MRIRIAAIGMPLLLSAAALVTAQTGDDLFRQCRNKELLDSDIPGAIQLCERVVRDFVSNRPLLARARLALCQIYDGVDPAKARQNCEAVAGMTDQPNLAAEGRARQEALAARDPAAPIRIVTPFTNDPFSFAISPDGRNLVFQATVDGRSQLWLQPVDPSTKPTPIPGTENARESSFPFFSPDGASIGFFAEQKLKTIDIRGGVAKELASVPNPGGGAWSSADVILFSIWGSGLRRVPAAGGSVASVTSLNDLYPKFLPDGRRFVFFRRDGAVGTVTVGSLDAEKLTPRLPANMGAALFAPPDHLLYVAGALFAQRMDLQKLAVAGDPIRIADQAGRRGLFPGLAAVSASAVGAVAYRTTAFVERQFFWMNRQGQRTGDLGPRDGAAPGRLRLSPDGRYVAFYRQAGSPLGSVWVINVTEGTPRQLRDGADTAVWSPDGENIAFAAVRTNNRNLYQQPVSILRGSGRWLKAAPSSPAESPDDWSRNGFVVYETNFSDSAGDLVAMPVSGGDSIPVVQTPAREQNGRFSPDGNWIAYESDEIGGRFEVHVQPFPGTPSLRHRVSVDGGTNPQWGRGGRELYFLSPDYKLMVAAVTLSANGREIEVGRPQPLFPSPLREGAEYEAAPDGDRFLINAPVEDAPPIYVLRNFAAAKK